MLVQLRYNQLNIKVIFQYNMIQDTEIKQSQPKKIAVYIATCFTWFVFTGLIGLLARTKKPMSDDLELTQSYMGIVDGFKFFSRALGFIYTILYPPQKPKRSFLICSIVTAICFVVMGMSTQFPKYSKGIILITMIIAGFARAYNMIPLIIVNQYFDSTSQNGRLLIGFWLSFGALGDVFSVLLCQYLLNALFIDWSVCVYIFTAIFLIPTTLTYFISDQIQMKQDNQTIQTNSIQHLKVYYRNIQNVKHSVQCCISNTFYFSIQLWFPYYFLMQGFGYQASLISIVYPLVFGISVPIYHYITKPCENFYPTISRTLLISNIILLIILIQLRPELSYFYLYLILIGLISFFQNGASYRILSAEIKARIQNDNKLMFLVISVIGMLTQIGIGISMLLIGFLMEIKLEYLLYILLIYSVIQFVLEMMRQVKSQGTSHNLIEQNDD